MSSLLTSIQVHLPIVHAWCAGQEFRILADGRPLSESQTADARRAGVAHPEKIRVLGVEELPRPDNEELMFIATHIGLFSSRAVGLCLGHGICLQHDFLHDRLSLVHECVHAGQYERKGGILPFLTDYLRECIEPGYPFGALEQEAILVSRDICEPHHRGPSGKDAVA